MDQQGSRFIQQHVEHCDSSTLDKIFQQLLPETLNLCTKVFSNYVVQKMFEFGSEPQRLALAESMRGHISMLSCQMYGCRVVQKALECVKGSAPLNNMQLCLATELQSKVVECVRDQNGNHVIQKSSNKSHRHTSAF
eukprot:GABV01000914.1.p2 GENE.GABV01000914.1~~GABV01000914.1.p2  ORF type:complete len:137 (+),score=37.37 GABV01000914.1:237-647(+)